MDAMNLPRHGLNMSLARWAALGAAALAALILGAVLYQAAYRGRVFPGVRVGSLDVGGLSAAEATARLAAAGLVADAVTLRDPVDGRGWPRAAADLGLAPEPAAWAAAAAQVGRTGANPFARLFHPLLFRLTRPAVPVTARFDPVVAAAGLQALAPEVDRSPTEARLETVAGRLEARPGIPGHQLDISGTLQALAYFAGQPVSDTVDIVVQRTAGRIPDLANVALAYNTAVSAPLNVGWQDAARFTIPSETVKEWVTVQDLPNPQGDAVPTVVFDQAAIARWLAERRDQIDRPARNARFGFDAQGQLAVLATGQTGLSLDIPRSVTAIEQAAYSDTRVGDLVVAETPPAVSSAAVERLRALDEIGRSSTSLVGAPEGRVKHLTAVAERLRGTAVPPGGHLALGAALGPLEALPGLDPNYLADGAPDSAVTQVCATWLRTVWWAGLPILERHAPPVRLGWVEPPVGLDCAVGPDQEFTFLNDTDDFIWFNVLVDRARGVLTVVLYGPTLERVVDATGPSVTQVVPPPPGRTVRSPRLPVGQRVQTQWSREGAEARVSRTVTAGARTITRDTWLSRYAAAPDVVLEGTGTELAAPSPGPLPANAPSATPPR